MCLLQGWGFYCTTIIRITEYRGVIAVRCHRYGLDAIPAEWLEKYSRSVEVIGLIEKLVQL